MFFSITLPVGYAFKMGVTVVCGLVKYFSVSWSHDKWLLHVTVYASCLCLTGEFSTTVNPVLLAAPLIKATP